MSILIGMATYFMAQLGLGIVIGKVLRYRRRERPELQAVIRVGGRVGSSLAAIAR